MQFVIHPQEEILRKKVEKTLSLQAIKLLYEPISKYHSKKADCLQFRED